MDNRWLAGKNQRGPAAISERQSKVDNCEDWITDDVGFNLKQLANSAVLSSGKINGQLVQNVQYYFFPSNLRSQIREGQCLRTLYRHTKEIFH